MSHDLVFKNIHVLRNQKNGSPVKVFSGMNLTIEGGAHVAVVGGSGVGKTTLLCLANRLDDPTKGHVSFGGTPVKELNVTDHRRNVALVLQLPCLFAEIVIENVCYSDVFLNKEPNHEKGEKLLELVGIEPDLIHRTGDSLSVGQMQRVCLARALYMEPKVLMLDETTASLDPSTAAEVWKRLVALSLEKEMTIIHVTHEPEKIRFADKVVLLADGIVAETGTPEEILSSPTTEAGRRFIGT